MAGEGHGWVGVAFYATLFRGDKFELALAEIVPVSLRYGASQYQAYRARDDRYKFQALFAFEQPLDWERYWNGPEFIGWRADYTSWYQVPLVPYWADLIVGGGLDSEMAGGDRMISGQP